MNAIYIDGPPFTLDTGLGLSGDATVIDTSFLSERELEKSE
jgi:hypothetical protein